MFCWQLLVAWMKSLRMAGDAEDLESAMKRMVCWVVAGMMAAGARGYGQQQSSAQQKNVPQAHSVATPRPAKVETKSAQIARMKVQLEDWAQLGRYRAADLDLPGTGEGRVVFYGDSITVGWVENGGKFFPGKPYVNRGISGQTTPQMLVRFRQDVVDLHPDAVLILAGTNDIAGNTGPSTLVMTEDNFRSMTEIAKANGIRVILASVTPVAKYPWKLSVADPAGKIKDLNTWLKSFCAQEKLTYVDYWTAMAGPDGGMKPGISLDGVHPNAAGYAMMEPIAEAAIEETAKPENGAAGGSGAETGKQGPGER
jgi:lysophospholipase L1-like esterase